MLSKEMAEVAASLRNLVKVWVASKREVFIPAGFIIVKCRRVEIELVWGK